MTKNTDDESVFFCSLKIYGLSHSILKATRTKLSCVTTDKLRNPIFGIVIQVVNGFGGITSANFDVFAKKSVYENLYIEFYMVTGFYTAVGKAQFQKFAGGDRRELFCGKQQFVGFAEQAIIFVVLFDKFKYRIQELRYIFCFDKSHIIEKSINQFVFVVFRYAVDIVIMGIE